MQVNTAAGGWSLRDPLYAIWHQIGGYSHSDPCLADDGRYMSTPNRSLQLADAKVVHAAGPGDLIPGLSLHLGVALRINAPGNPLGAPQAHVYQAGLLKAEPAVKRMA